MLERVGVIAYHLKLSKTSKIHLVFQVSSLKKVISNYHEEFELPKGFGTALVLATFFYL